MSFLVRMCATAVAMLLIGYLLPGLVRVDTVMAALAAAFVLGLVFGIALGPCTFAFMAPMLGVTFRLGASNPAYAAMLLFAYGIGHCSVIVAAGTSTELVQRFLNWNEQSRGTLWVKRVCGLLVILGGLWMIYTAH